MLTAIHEERWARAWRTALELAAAALAAEVAAGQRIRLARPIATADELAAALEQMRRAERLYALAKSQEA
ncbi:MAG: hypothetical protein IT201_14565 [Thermoleophilia bacterium]|nr:hypothetical protein [Thermoleophilia bacterium]